MGKRPRSKTLPEIIAFARELRREATFPETLLWSLLRNRQIGGFKFRRQHDLAPFTVDFYCAEAKLVVEINGISHVGQATRDESRTALLNAQGLRVVRFTNDEVLQSLEEVAVAIARELGLNW